MLNRFIPWRWILSRVARSRGFIDPFALLARLQRFAQPAEVSEPIELLRAGVAFHARGLLNARAIQHNLDWVWPFWVERQFNPLDVSFVPRAFSITHINLTHRNWTAVGLPDLDWLPIVDPRGLVTPFFDGWSLDTAILTDDGRWLLPARDADAQQRQLLLAEPVIETRTRNACCELWTLADVIEQDGRPCCRLRITGRAARGAMLILSVRPANPEGISLIHDIRWDSERLALGVEDKEVRLSRQPDRVCMSEYHRGDVLRGLAARPPRAVVQCEVGLATAAAVFRLAPDAACEVTALVPLPPQPQRIAQPTKRRAMTTWSESLQEICRLQVPDGRYQFLFDSAVRTLILHSPGDVYPGPFTYKRFWFRDAAFILDALLALGLAERVRRVLERYPSRQDRSGYFRSQEGEWDSNGAALWIIERYHRVTGASLSGDLVGAVLRGAAWIFRKRLPDDLPALHAGLLPAGFSAEHLGLNDFYFWDDFWSAAGFRAAAAICRSQGDEVGARNWEHQAALLLAAVDRAIAASEIGQFGLGMAASPYRRLDSGAIGSIAVGYPLQLWDAHDPRLLRTVDFLLERCSFRGGFFQDMIHSGVNAYLTLHLAQVLLRAGDARYAGLIQAVADLASPTGQWPEAIHPLTLGGCMGDGQHVWAAAEWVLMMRNLFLREEGQRLVIGAGLRREWLQPGQHLLLGPTPTTHGMATVEIIPRGEEVEVTCDARWRNSPPILELAIPGYESRTISGSAGSVILPRTEQLQEAAAR